MFFNLCLQGYWDILRCAQDDNVTLINEGSIPVCHRPFSFWESTGSKQTLNGLFYVYPKPLEGLKAC
jgi:hypothetical protein